MPPIDPPVLPGGREGIHVATGFSVSPDEEASADPAPRADENIRSQATLLLRQDSLTSSLRLGVRVEKDVDHLLGQVPSSEDADRAGWLLGELLGVVKVIDETELVQNSSG